MTKKIKRIWSWISGLLVAAVVVLAVALVGVRLVGLRPMYILSGSMEPTYPTGALIYVKEVDTAQLQAGDVITFLMDADTIATHRIAGIVPDEEDPNVIRFRTKGDANEMEDSKLVHYANVVGVPVFTVPKLGYLVSYIQEPPGSYVAISVVAILMMLMFLPDLFGDDKDNSAPRPAKEKQPNKERSPQKEKPAKPVREKPVRETRPPTGRKRPAPDAPEEEPVPPRPEEPWEAPAPEAEEAAFDLESILNEFR